MRTPGISIERMSAFFCVEVDKNMTKEYNIFIDKRGIFMKYKLLLVGTNKMIINEFFQQLEGKFELQTSSLRYADLLSHIKYFHPEAMVLCMNMEGQEQIDTIVSLKEEFQRNNISLVVIAGREAGGDFQKRSGGMVDLSIKTPLAIQLIGDKIKDFLDEGNWELQTADIEPEAFVVQQPQPFAQAKSLQTQQKHILIVDDDPMMLKLIKELLKDEYKVATAISGIVALNFLESRGTDLVLLDYEMPGENGLQVLEKIRKNPKTAQLPVVFLSGVSDHERIRKLVGFKPQGYLLKPVEKADLMKIIKENMG